MANHKRYSVLFARLFLLLCASHPAFASSETAAATSSKTSEATSKVTSGLQTMRTVVASSSLASSSTTPTSTSNPIPEMPEYSFVYPAQNLHVNTLVNYKDTIDLTWDVTYPFNPPTLLVQCWARNASINSTSLTIQRKPDLQTDIATIKNSNQDYIVNMTAYEQYNPCQFTLADSTNASITRGPVKSALIEVLDDKNTPAKNWTADNEAPVSSAWPKSGAVTLRAGSGKLWMALGWVAMVAAGMSLL